MRRTRALTAALAAFDDKNSSAAPQGSPGGQRLIDKATRLWSGMMQKKLLATPALATLVALPIAGYATFYMMKDSPFNFGGDGRRPMARPVARGQERVEGARDAARSRPRR